MCLIIYSEKAKLPPRDWFAEAAVTNPDGIGVMSADGIAKFLGKRKTRRAWRYVSQLAADGLPFAVHFRWATHGRVSRANCHPFEIPGTGAHLMHNGVLWTCRLANDEMSDTRIFAEDVMPGYISMTQRGAHDYLTALNAEAAGNRLLVMHPDGKRFDVVNRQLWTMRDGILYSNTYSINALDDWGGYATRASKAKDTLGSWIKGAVTRGYSKPAMPSGPSMGADDDYSGFADDIEAELWQEDYESAVEAGFDHHDAVRYAELEADRREMSTRSGCRVDAYTQAKRDGFDWHDSSTWGKYPIPGTEYSERVLNRHGDGETEDYTRPDARDMFI